MAKAAAWFLLLCTALPAWAADERPGEMGELRDLSLEQLASIRVTSVSLHEEPITEAPASIYVITPEAIRRSGATTLPEILRLAPNLQVARVSTSSYAITSRGFNNAGNKLQVLIDGRIVYSPLYSGVLWDAQDVVIEDIARVEVISGPGGALWGSNAVNGVINVITKPTRETRDTLVSLSGGELDKAATARLGGEVGGLNYRVYAKGSEQSRSENGAGSTVMDDWNRVQAGFRVGKSTAPGEGYLLQGDVYEGRAGQVSPPDYQHFSGANLIARWTGKVRGTDRLRVQAYYDQTERRAPGALGDFSEHLKTVDVSFQHYLGGIEGHGVIWGAGVRRMRDALTNYPTLAYLPDVRDMDYANIFVQDDIELGNRVALTLGAKAERNPYTGWEFMPNARLDWKLARGQLAWAAISRSVRTPARLDRDLYAPAVARPPPAPPFVIAGGPDFQSEISNVLEFGYRAQVTSNLSYSVTAFHHRYDKLRSVEIVFDPAFNSPFIIVGNKMDGHANGIEMWGTWQARPGWRLEAGGTYLDQKLKLKPGSTDPTGPSAAGNDPRFQWMVRSSYDLGAFEIDVGVRHVASLPSPVVAAYTAVDARLGWRVNRNMDLALVAQNLFDPDHVEVGAAASEIPRRVYLQARVRF